MRTTLLSTLLSLSLPLLSQIPNGGFDAWHSTGDYDDPDGWTTMNALTFPMGGGLSCDKAPPFVGQWAVKVTTRTTQQSVIVPGVIFAGTNEHPGFPYDQRPGMLNGEWRFSMEGGDVGYITVNLSRWNPDINGPEPVGAGYTYMSGALPAWQPFSIPITYVSGLVPDTATIQIISSYGAATDGSTLWVDDLQFSVPLGVAEPPAVQELQLRPSPDFDQLVVLAPEPLLEVLLVDMSGRELGRHAPNVSTTSVDIAELPAGVYLTRVRFADGHVAARAFVKP
jgi:hypothetical protein